MIRMIFSEEKGESGMNFKECLSFLEMLSESIEMLSVRYQNVIWEKEPVEEYESFYDVFVIKELYQKIAEKSFLFMQEHHLSNGISMLGYYLLYKNQKDFDDFFTMKLPDQALNLMQKKYNLALPYIDSQNNRFDRIKGIKGLKNRKTAEAAERNQILLEKIKKLGEKENKERQRMEEDYEMFSQEKIDIFPLFEQIEQLELLFSGEEKGVTICSGNYGVLVETQGQVKENG